MAVHQTGQIRHYICDAESDLASVADPKLGSSADCLAEDTHWYYDGSSWVQSRALGLSLTGATTPTRYVGRHDGGAPTTGTFAVGDFTTDVTTPAIWVCSVAGTPGTWVQAGGGLPSWFQSGSGHPVGVVTPSQKGALYQDTANGGLYTAADVTNLSWISIGGNTDLGENPYPVGVFVYGVNGELNVLSRGAYLADPVTFGVGGNGNYSGWTFHGADGAQTFDIRLGPGDPNGQFWQFLPGGGLKLPNGNALYNTATIPGAGIGSNNDWAITADGMLCTKKAGAWVVVVSEAPGFRALTTPPVSTTVYQNTTGFDLTASLRAVLAVNPALASDCKVEISPDNFASAQVWADPALAAGALAVANAPEYIEFPIPANWYYKVTATNATIGALVAIG